MRRAEQSKAKVEIVGGAELNRVKRKIRKCKVNEAKKISQKGCEKRKETEKEILRSRKLNRTQRTIW